MLLENCEKKLSNPPVQRVSAAASAELPSAQLAVSYPSPSAVPPSPPTEAKIDPQVLQNLCLFGDGNKYITLRYPKYITLLVLCISGLTRKLSEILVTPKHQHFDFLTSPAW